MENFQTFENILYLAKQNHLKNELHNVFSGKSQVRFGELIQAIADYLKNGAQTSSTSQDDKYYKREEAKKLIKYISEANLWIEIDTSQYVSEGAEQKVYLKDTENSDKLFVLLLM